MKTNYFEKFSYRDFYLHHIAFTIAVALDVVTTLIGWRMGFSESNPLITGTWALLGFSVLRLILYRSVELVPWQWLRVGMWAGMQTGVWYVVLWNLKLILNI